METEISPREIITPPKTNKLVYTIEETELAKFELEPNLYLRVISTGPKTVVDLRKFYKGYPTKRGVRFNLELFSFISEKVKDFLNNSK